MTGLIARPRRPWPLLGSHPELAKGGEEGVFRLPQEVRVSLPLPYGSATRSGGSFRSDRPPPDRNLALELVRVAEAGAMAAGRWVGRGDKNGGDGAAVDAMRALIGAVSMKGVVVIGEGEKDEAPMPYNGEQGGGGQGG